MTDKNLGSHPGAEAITRRSRAVTTGATRDFDDVVPEDGAISNEQFTPRPPCKHVVWKGFNVRTLCSKPLGHPGSCS